MQKGPGRVRVLLPGALLVAPEVAEVGADLRPKIRPVVPMQTVKANHVDRFDQIAIVVVPCAALSDVHLCAGSEHDSTPYEVFKERFLHGGKTIKHLSGTLVISNVDNLVCMQDLWVINVLLSCVLDVFEHSRQIISTHFRKGPVPVELRVVFVAMSCVLHAVVGATVISKPDVIS